MTRICLLAALLSSLMPAQSLAQGSDDFLDDAAGEIQEEKKKGSPIFFLPLQPVWKTIEPSLIDDAIKNIAAELNESGGYKVEQFNPRLGGGTYKDPEPRLRRRWEKELRSAEKSTKRRRFSAAIKTAGRIVRQVLDNPEHLRSGGFYCRAMALVAEGEIRRGRRNKALTILEMVVSGCAEVPDGDAEPSAAFKEALADAVAEVRRRDPGRLVVHADEPKATVFLNGAKVGFAPLTLRDLPPGKHLLAVIKAGHKPFGKVVKIGSGETVVQARLTKPLGG